jgi:hypothetical protein
MGSDPPYTPPSPPPTFQNCLRFNQKLIL